MSHSRGSSGISGNQGMNWFLRTLNLLQLTVLRKLWKMLRYGYQLMTLRLLLLRGSLMFNLLTRNGENLRVISSNVMLEWLGIIRVHSVVLAGSPEISKALPSTTADVLTPLVHRNKKLIYNHFIGAVESMSNMGQSNIIFETSSREVREAFLKPHLFPDRGLLLQGILHLLSLISSWSLEHLSAPRNIVAQAIADGVIQGSRSQSYISIGGPAWLRFILDQEMRNST